MNAKQSQRGFTLTEMMVSVALGIFIITGMVQLYTSNAQYYRVQENLSRLQENGRFALHLLANDITAAGYIGCAPPLDTDIINQLLAADSYDVDDEIVGSEAITATEWAPTLFATGITAIGAVGGSDIITIRKAIGAGTSITAHATAAADLEVADFSGFKIDDIVLAENCEETTIFKISGITGAGEIQHSTSSNITADLAAIYDNDAYLYKLLSRTYFIRNNSVGQPALYRKDRDNALSEELIEGIEAMQIIYGEDTDSSGSPNTYLTADNVGDMNNIVSIRISLLVRTLEDNIATEAVPYTIFGVTTTPDDLVIRRVFTTTIAIRNNLS